MHLSFRIANWFPVVLSLALGVLVTHDVRAADGGTTSTPCGNFDLTGSIACEVKVSGSCMADCSPITFKAACSGMCNATSDTMCVDNCGTQCVAMCNPALLDCFAGCHAECDQPTIALCQQKHPGEDCAATARAQCDLHCKDSCAIPPNNCSEHCNKCCTGSCTTQVNFDCDFSCFVDVRGGCEVQCQKPEGALFCNGQYVHASDVPACINYLLSRGIEVEGSAKGMVNCDLSGCHESGSSKGCAVSAGAVPQGGSLAVLALAAVGLIAGARRQRRAAVAPRERTGRTQR